MKKCSTVSFEGQVIFVGIDVHKESWVVNLRHCHRELDKFSMNPCPEMLAKYLRKVGEVSEEELSGSRIPERLRGGILRILGTPAFM